MKAWARKLLVIFTFLYDLYFKVKMAFENQTDFQVHKIFYTVWSAVLKNLLIEAPKVERNMSGGLAFQVTD